MADQIRGRDAAGTAPKPQAKKPDTKTPDPSAGMTEQEAPNYNERTDKGLAEPVEKLDSAND